MLCTISLLQLSTSYVRLVRHVSLLIADYPVLVLDSTSGTGIGTDMHGPVLWVLQ